MPQDTRTTALQEQVLKSIRTSQDATLTAVRTWVDTIATVTPRVYQVFGVPTQEDVFGFAQQVLAAQRDFVTGLFEAGVAAGQAVPEAARQAAQAAQAAGRAAANSENARPVGAKA